jgi:hypothetical protein
MEGGHETSDVSSIGGLSFFRIVLDQLELLGGFWEK